MNCLLSIVTDRRLLATLLIGAAACVGEAPEGPNENGNLSLRAPGGGGTAPGDGVCADILKADCTTNSAEKTRQCEADRQTAYTQCVTAERCDAALTAAVSACGPKGAENSPTRAAHDACLKKASDAHAACTGSGSGPGTP